MRNKYAGKCYRCGGVVPPGGGHFERRDGGWATQHAHCALQFRGTDVGRDPEADARRKERLAQRQIEKWKRAAQGTGKIAQHARRNLRDRGITC